MYDIRRWRRCSIYNIYNIGGVDINEKIILLPLLNTFDVHDGFEIISYIVKQLVEVNALFRR